MSEKVSILTPCYNGEQYFDLYLENIIRQDYDNVEVILIDDGSVNSMEGYAGRLQEAIEQKGYTFIFRRKVNGGAASAVDFGLQFVTGSYLMLLDMDDELFERAVSAKAEVLTAHPECDVAISNGYYKFVNQIHRKVPFVKKGTVDPGKIFERLLSIDFFNWPGSYMVRCDSFFAKNGKNSIFVSPYGQNLQILLPAVYGGKAIFIEEPLMYYCIRKKSFSHPQEADRMIELVSGYEEIRETVIKGMQLPEAETEHYLCIIRTASIRNKLRFACRNYNREEMKRQYKELLQLQGVRPADKMVYLVGHNVITTFLYKAVNKCGRCLSSKVV